MRKRFLPFFLAFLLLSTVFAGCSTQKEAATDSSENQDQTSYNANSSGTDSEKTDDSTDSGNDSTPSGGQTDPDADVPAVYMTTDISPEGLTAVYEALGWTPTGRR